MINGTLKELGGRITAMPDDLLKSIIHEIILCLEYKNAGERKVSSYFPDAVKNIRWKSRKIFKPYRKSLPLKLKSKSLNQLNPDFQKGRGEEKRAVPFIDLAIKQAEENIKKLITNYQQAL